MFQSSVPKKTNIRGRDSTVIQQRNDEQTIQANKQKMDKMIQKQKDVDTNHLSLPQSRNENSRSPPQGYKTSRSEESRRQDLPGGISTAMTTGGVTNGHASMATNNRFKQIINGVSQ